MRRFAIIVLACALGVAVAFAFGWIAIQLHPCRGEGLTCSMSLVLSLIYIPVFGFIALICFGVAVYWKGPRILNPALLIPLLSFLAFAFYVKYSEFSVREFHDIREKDIQELLQVIIPIALTLIVPWAVLSRCAEWLEPKRM